MHKQRHGTAFSNCLHTDWRFVADDRANSIWVLTRESWRIAAGYVVVI
jgi:hypothetical protein